MMITDGLCLGVGGGQSNMGLPVPFVILLVIVRAEKAIGEKFGPYPEPELIAESPERSPEPMLNLPPSRCWFQEVRSPVPGFSTHRVQTFDLIRPVNELLREYFDLWDLNVKANNVKGFISTSDPVSCVTIGQAVDWEEFSHEDALKFENGDNIIMNTLVASGGGETLCFNDLLMNHGDFCVQGFKDLQNQSIYFSDYDRLGANDLQGVSLSHLGKIGDFFEMSRNLNKQNISGPFICKSTKQSLSLLGLMETLKTAIIRYVKLVGYLNFGDNVEKYPGCPNILADSILNIRGNKIRGETNISQEMQISNICSMIWVKRIKKSILSYLFTNDFNTLQNLVTSNNKNLQNIRILYKNFKSMMKWDNKLKHSVTLIKNHLEQEVYDLKQYLILRENFMNIKHFHENVERDRIYMSNFLYDVFLRAELIVVEGQRKIEKILEGLGKSQKCLLDQKGDFSCQTGPGIWEIEDNILTLKTQSNKLEVKKIILAKCLFMDDRNIFKGNNLLYVADKKFFHSPKLTIPRGCAIQNKDENYVCTSYFGPWEDEGSLTSGPDSFGGDIYYILLEHGIFVQNVGPAVPIVFGEKAETKLLTIRPVWIHKEFFPIQIAKKKYNFNDLFSVSKEFDLNFLLISQDRDQLDYYKWKEIHKDDLKPIGIEKIYGSFTEIFKNNNTVKAISVSSIICSGLLLISCIIFVTFCCSKKRGREERRYVRYSRRAATVDLTRAGERSSEIPASAPPVEIRSRSPESRFARLLHRI